MPFVQNEEIIVEINFLKRTRTIIDEKKRQNSGSGCRNSVLRAPSVGVSDILRCAPDPTPGRSFCCCRWTVLSIMADWSATVGAPTPPTLRPRSPLTLRPNRIDPANHFQLNSFSYSNLLVNQRNHAARAQSELSSSSAARTAMFVTGGCFISQRLVICIV